MILFLSSPFPIAERLRLALLALLLQQQKGATLLRCRHAAMRDTGAPASASPYGAWTWHDGTQRIRSSYRLRDAALGRRSAQEHGIEVEIDWTNLVLSNRIVHTLSSGHTALS